jgi:hypothetical protein
LNQRESGVGNSYAVNLGGATDRGVTVQDNLFYRIQARGLVSSSQTGHESMLITKNTFADPDQDSCLVDHRGAFTGYTYEDNSYFSSGAANRWFCVDGTRSSIDDWMTASGESDATELGGLTFSDPDRDLESYAASLGTGDLADFIALARRQTRLNYRPELTAPAINDYIRAGFDR